MGKIRVGIVGVQPERSWAAIAHIPALRALGEFYEITALSTTRQESADAAAKYFGIGQAFGGHEALVASPEVDLVAVTVKVPHHYEIVSAALEAGKAVYCEWPLGNGLKEAEDLAALAKRKGVGNVVGLQARFQPAVRYAGDLIRQGMIGEVLSVDLVGTGLNWGAFVDPPNAYTSDKKNGATVLTIPLSHTVDAACSILGEIEELSALLANRRNTTFNVGTGAAQAMTAEDQVAFLGTLAGGAVMSAHYRGGMSKGTGLLLEINGSKGDLRITGAFGHAQLTDLTLSGAGEGDEAMKVLEVPDSYYATGIRSGVALAVAEVYAQYAKDPKGCPDFAHAVSRHRMVEAIEESAKTGSRVKL